MLTSCTRSGVGIGVTPRTACNFILRGGARAILIDTEAGGSDRVVGFMQDRQSVELGAQGNGGPARTGGGAEGGGPGVLPCARAWT